MKYPLTRKKKIPGCYRPPQVQIRARYFGIQKLTWMKRFLALDDDDDDDPIITTLIHLGNSSISQQMPVSCQQTYNLLKSLFALSIAQLWFQLQNIPLQYLR